MHCNRLAPVDFEKHRALTECPGCIYGVANGSLPRPCWPYSSLYEYNDLDKRFDAWKVPALIPLKGIWVGNLSAMPVLTSGTAPTDPNSLRLQDTADALLYFGPRDSLTGVTMSRADLEGTPGGAYMAARATCSRKWRTWPNDPEAPFGEMRCC